MARGRKQASCGQGVRGGGGADRNRAAQRTLGVSQLFSVLTERFKLTMYLPKLTIMCSTKFILA